MEEGEETLRRDGKTGAGRMCSVREEQLEERRRRTVGGVEGVEITSSRGRLEAVRVLSGQTDNIEGKRKCPCEVPR